MLMVTLRPDFVTVIMSFPEPKIVLAAGRGSRSHGPPALRRWPNSQRRGEAAGVPVVQSADHVSGTSPAVAHRKPADRLAIQ